MQTICLGQVYCSQERPSTQIIRPGRMYTRGLSWVYGFPDTISHTIHPGRMARVLGVGDPSRRWKLAHLHTVRPRRTRARARWGC